MHGIDKAALPECSLAGTPLGLTQSIQDAYVLRGAPPFPIEIIQHIIIRAEFNSLCNLSQVNKPFQFCAERIMYRRIGPLSLTGTIRCLRSLTERPTLALNVRSFEAGDLGEEPILFPAFFNLLSCALRHMKLLTELTLLFSGPFSHIFHDTPFSLTKLTSALHWDNVFTSWIVNQRNITAALLCGRFIRNTKLPPSALPRLSRVSASPLILASIVPGRPVKDVEVCLGHPWLFSEDLLATTMKILNFSSGPIESLQIVSHLAETTATTIGAVSVIPRIIPQLNFLALHAVSGAFTTEFLDGLGDIISSFTRLKAIMILSKERSDALLNAGSSAVLAEKWHSACKTLDCVSFPDVTWVLNKHYGWLTLRDLERILAEREQLVKRGTEIQSDDEGSHLRDDFTRVSLNQV